jgi:integrase
VTRRFPDTREGRAAADAFAKTLTDAKRFYDVRISVNGETRMQSFARRKDAETWIVYTGPDRLRGVVTDPRRGQVCFGELVERWFEARTAKRPRSIDRDREIMRLHVLPAIGRTAVAVVSRANVQALVDQWVSEKLAPATVARQYSAVRAVFSWAMASDIIDKTPCRGTKLPQDRKRPRRRISPGDLERLAAVLQRTREERAKYAAPIPAWFGPSQAVMMWVGAATGLRWSEVAGRQVRDLNLAGAEISVTRQLDRNRNLVEPKSAAGERTFAVPKWLAKELAAHLARRGLSARNGDALVFTGAKGGPLNYSAWRRTVWAPACDQAGLAGLGFHDLRRANATALVAAKADPKVAQTRLGHADVRLTLGLYADVTPEADRIAADAVGAWLRPSVRGTRDRNAIRTVSGIRQSRDSHRK